MPACRHPGELREAPEPGIGSQLRRIAHQQAGRTVAYHPCKIVARIHQGDRADILSLDANEAAPGNELSPGAESIRPLEGAEIELDDDKPSGCPTWESLLLVGFPVLVRPLRVSQKGWER